MQRAIREALRQPPGHGPLYLRLSDALAGLIEGRVLRPGDRLPPERDLAEVSGASRVTIRNAIAALAERGLVRQRQGSGTYVTQEAAPRGSIARIISLSEDLRQRGLISRSVWLRRLIAPATAQEQRDMVLPAGARVARLIRLRLADERPLALERTILPADILPDPALVEQSLYETLGALGCLPDLVTQDVTAVNLTPMEAARLGALPASAALRLIRTGHARDGRIIERCEAVFRPDAYDLHFDFGRSGLEVAQ